MTTGNLLKTVLSIANSLKGKRVGNITAEMPTSGIYNLISANPYFPTSLIKPTIPHKFYGSKEFLI